MVPGSQAIWASINRLGKARAPAKVSVLAVAGASAYQVVAQRVLMYVRTLIFVRSGSRNRHNKEEWSATLIVDHGGIRKQSSWPPNARAVALVRAIPPILAVKWIS
jgi:hypothetical protein